MCRQKTSPAGPVTATPATAWPRTGSAAARPLPPARTHPAGSQAGAAALYERLPRGPHGLDRREVLAHQRARIHGALTIAVAQSGYSAMTVAHVTRLAGVSRRSFYELFSDKDHCLLDTLDALGRRWVHSAARACAPCAGLEERAGALAHTVASLAAAEPQAALLLLARSRGAGAAAVRRRLALARAYEQILHRPAQPRPLPPAVTRALVGGMLEIATAGAHEPASPAAPLAAQLCAWLLAAHDPAAARAAALLAASARARLRALPACPRLPPRTAPERERGPRERLRAAALRLAARGEHESPSGAEIADAAGVPVSCFLDLFRDGAACHEEALAAAVEDALAVAAAAARGGEWPLSVRPALEATFAHLAARPLHARAMTGWPAPTAAPVAAAVPLRRLALLLLRHAPASTQCAAVRDGVVGALWHTIARQAGRGRLELLPLLAADVAYVALAPALGAEAAAEVAAGDLTAAGVCG